MTPDISDIGYCKAVSAKLGSFCSDGKCNLYYEPLSCYVWTGKWWSNWTPEEYKGITLNPGRCFGKKGIKPGEYCTIGDVNPCSIGTSCILSKKTCNRPEGCSLCLQKDSYFDECDNDFDCGLGLVCLSIVNIKVCLFIDQYDGRR